MLTVASAASAGRAVAGTGTVVAGGLTGLEQLGTIGGILGSLVTVVMLYLAITGNNRAKAREYREEIAKARAEGRDEATREANTAAAVLNNRIRELTDTLTETRSERDHLRDIVDRYGYLRYVQRGNQQPETD